ncbi:hypothetical protein Enr10x_27310 [Gimesia panareensis]|uniref:Uncharacterized protein n=1 Tax=Gimesia panareensis TaxID=2527978 RepID=A0A517Q713_9PLAN|nr:hypothetical protein Enr10x_27310 [Gimesia panareensis]
MKLLYTTRSPVKHSFRPTGSSFTTKGAYVADLVTRTSDVELSIGDTIQVGDQFLTVVDIEGDEILFQLDTENPAERDASSGSNTRSCR